MPSHPNQLPDDDEPSPEVGYLEEDDSHDHEESDNGEETEFDPVGLSVEQLKFLGDNTNLAEKGEMNQQLLHLHDSSELGPMAAFVAKLESRMFYESMFSRVTARVEAAGTAVPPTVQSIEQGQDRGEEQGEEEEDVEQAPATERPMSDTETVPPQPETPTQP